MGYEFKVFTLNCWGIPLISKDRKPRMQAIGDALMEADYDIVCLQEVWTDRDFFLIRDKVVDVLPYAHYFYSGVFGSGVCVLSKHPIQEAFFHQWPLNGYIHKVQHGDWFGGKGVGLCKIAFNQYTVNVYTAHLHAEYNRNSDEYEAHRILQAYDTAQFIMLTSQSSDLIVLAGDLNTQPGDLAYRVLLTVSGLVDAFPGDSLSPNLGATCWSMNNSYRPAASVLNNSPGERIDYILYHPGSRMQVEVKHYCHPLPDRVPNQSYSYSDHEAVESILVITKKMNPSTSTNFEEKKCVLEDCIDVLNKALNRLKYQHCIWYLIFATVLFAMLVLSCAFNTSVGYSVIFNMLRVIVVILISYCLLMATVWNKMEKHGVLAGKLAIEITLRSICNES